MDPRTKDVSDPRRIIPFAPLVLTPREVEERLVLGDQFIEEIMTKGEVLYARLKGLTK